MLSSLLDQTATHQRPTPTADASGGTSRAFATQTASVKCAVWPTSSRTVSQFLRPDITADYVVATDQNLSAKKGDRFLMSDGSYYLIEAIAAPFSNAAITSEVLYPYGCSRRTV